MRIEVVHSAWGADGAEKPFFGGVHGPDERAELAAPSDVLLRSIAGAESAGAVRVIDCTPAERAALDGTVQSQEDGESAFEAAQGEWIPDVVDASGAVVERGYWTGGWHHGNLTQFVADTERKFAEAVSRGASEDAASLETLIDEARTRLASVEAPA